MVLFLFHKGLAGTPAGGNGGCGPGPGHRAAGRVPPVSFYLAFGPGALPSFFFGGALPKRGARGAASLLGTAPGAAGVVCGPGNGDLRASDVFHV